MISPFKGSQHKVKDLVDQDVLTKVLHSIFPYEDNSINSRKKSALRYPSGSYFELDFWIPKYNLCFEFQDKYHYVTAWYSHRTLSHVQQRDNFKINTAHKKGITLIIVPCWWDATSQSLIATIQFQRPDIMPNFPLSNSCFYPIPFNPPKNFFSDNEIPYIGELMVASFPRDNLFASTACSWWVGEKYDGVRCCWNAAEKQLYSRAGNIIDLERDFNHFFPQDSFLDTEMWLGKRNFYQAQRLTSGGIVFWDMLRFVAFDVPSKDFQQLPFESRYSHLLSNVPISSPLISVATRLKVRSEDIMEKIIHQTLETEGEGLILRKPFSLYENGRSKSLIKLKGSMEDKEGIVIEKSPDKSVVLKLANGVIFSVPYQNIYVNKIAVGDVITFSYKKGEEYANATIYQIRTDLSWAEIVRNEAKAEQHKNIIYNNNTTTQNGNIASIPKNSTKINTKRSWTESTMRLYLENLAKKQKLDPLLPETWYNISPASIHKTEKGAVILGYFKGGYVSALKKLFPDIGLNFTDLGSHYSLLRMKDFSNRRKFCENFAKAHSFDPYNPEHWYQQSKENFLSFKGSKTLLRYYRGNLPKALMSIFPDIGLKRSLLYALWNFTPQYERVLQKYKKSS